MKTNGILHWDQKYYRGHNVFEIRPNWEEESVDAHGSVSKFRFPGFLFAGPFSTHERGNKNTTQQNIPEDLLCSGSGSSLSRVVLFRAFWAASIFPKKNNFILFNCQFRFSLNMQWF